MVTLTAQFLFIPVTERCFGVNTVFNRRELFRTRKQLLYVRSDGSQDLTVALEKRVCTRLKVRLINYKVVP